MNDDKHKRITILFPSGHLDIVPAVKNLATILADHAYQIDVFALENITSPRPELSHPNVKLHLLPWKQRKVYESSVLITFLFSLWMLPKLIKGNYACLVGAGIRGLIASGFLSLLTRLPVIYHSLELYPSSEMQGLVKRAYKWIERWCNHKAAFTIIQDELRARFLAEDNGIPLDRIVFFPNSPIGRASDKKTEYLRKRFHIPRSKGIILYIGRLFAPWAMSLEIVKAAQDWPEGWVLVLHGNSTPSTPQEQRFLHRLREADRKRRTVFSLDPLPHKEFEELVASADIGLVLYKKTSENMYQLGLSSGKLAQYLKCGLPVVVSDFPSLRSIVDGYRCGICVQNLEEMKRVIEEIFADYKEYSNRSIQCFNDLFSLDNYSPSILAIVRILINSG